MAEPKLTVVNNTETVAQRVARLQTEARALANDHTNQLMQQMADLAAMADEIANGGDAYLAGARQMARTLSDDLASKMQTLGSIMMRKG